MAKSAPRHRRTSNSRKPGSSRNSAGNPKQGVSSDAIKAAEEVALAAFGSGLKLAAAFSTVAAKTTSLALASLASGADKFSELVKKETFGSVSHSTTRARRKVVRRKPSRQRDRTGITDRV